MIIKILFFVGLILFLILPAHSKTTITLTTLDWEPYIGQSLKKQGYVAEIIRESYKRSGYLVKLKFTPWSRTVNLAKIGQVDGYFPEYYADGIKTFAMFSEPFKGGPMGFFKQKKSNIEFQTLQDLKPYKIGIVRDYVNTKEFDEADYLFKEPVSNDLINLKKLIGGRIDLIIADQFVGMYLMDKYSLKGRDNIEFMSPPLEIKDLYLCISKKASGANRKLEAFNKGLKEIMTDGTLDKILSIHGF